jgi:hypothetical protein
LSFSFFTKSGVSPPDEPREILSKPVQKDNKADFWVYILYLSKTFFNIGFFKNRNLFFPERHSYYLSILGLLSLWKLNPIVDDYQ